MCLREEQKAEAVAVESLPEPYKSEILIEKYGAEIEATVKVVDTTL